jgi:hypothetical protein
MTFRMTVALVIIGVGAVVGLARSDSDTFAGKVMSGFGGALLAVLGAGLVIMLIGEGGDSEGGDVADGRVGR